VASSPPDPAAAAAAATLPLATRELAEILLERLDCGSGHWEVLLVADDGRLHTVRRNEKLGIPALERFDQTP
jgi:hypothetical protein